MTKKLSGWARGVRYAGRNLPIQSIKDNPLTHGELLMMLANAWYVGFKNGKKQLSRRRGKR